MGFNSGFKGLKCNIKINMENKTGECGNGSSLLLGEASGGL